MSTDDAKMMSGLLRRPFTRVLATRGVHTEARIAKLGYTLPTLPQPVGAYTLAVKQGGWVYCAGHLPFKGEGVSHARRLNLSLALTAALCLPVNNRNTGPRSEEGGVPEIPRPVGRD